MRAGTNAVEGHKASKNGNALAIREDLPDMIARGPENMTAAEKDLLKWLGVFFRKPTPGCFMMRISALEQKLGTTDHCRSIGRDVRLHAATIKPRS